LSAWRRLLLEQGLTRASLTGEQSRNQPLRMSDSPRRAGGFRHYILMRQEPQNRDVVKDRFETDQDALACTLDRADGRNFFVTTGVNPFSGRFVPADSCSQISQHLACICRLDY
jgi:hypothetical protein